MISLSITIENLDGSSSTTKGFRSIEDLIEKSPEVIQTLVNVLTENNGLR